MVFFAPMLAQNDVAFAGRAFATYGGVCIVTSLIWMWAIEGNRPDWFDSLGAALCVAGVLVILFGPRVPP